MTSTSTIVYSNGSKFAGQSPDPVEMLFERLRTYTLNPRFEKYGGFAENLPAHLGGGPGWVRFHGNFLKLSAVFNIDTNDPDLSESLIVAIQENQATQSYKAARRGEG